MNRLQKLILVVGLAAFGLLLWKLDAAAVWRMVSKVGWAFPFLLLLESGAHAFNAYGWRFSFRAEHAASFPMRELLRLRVLGDGVNYLTPSAQIAGEFARASLLNPSQPLPVRAASVVVAKFAQGAGQALFALFGTAFFLQGKVPALAPYEGVLAFLAVFAAILMAALVAYETGRRPLPKRGATNGDGGLRAVPGELARYLADHPGRFCAATAFYAGGFAWGALEAFLICRLLGTPVGPGTAVAIEALSCVIDGLLFMVPAKAGTQEAGKTAIFTLLGLKPEAGLAFGVVRHAREILWACLGLGLYSLELRGRPGLKRRLPLPEKREAGRPS